MFQSPESVWLQAADGEVEKEGEKSEHECKCTLSCHESTENDEITVIVNWLLLLYRRNQMLGNLEAGTIFSSCYSIFITFSSPAFICDDSFQSLFYNVEGIWNAL